MTMIQLVNLLIPNDRPALAARCADHAARPPQGDASTRVTRDEMSRLFATDLAVPRLR